MKYKIEKLKPAQKEISGLTKNQQKALKDDFDLIENKGIEYEKDVI